VLSTRWAERSAGIEPTPGPTRRPVAISDSLVPRVGEAAPLARSVALLRAVNLGGSTQVSMGDLRDHLTASGFTEVRTLLQSGNVVFQTNLRTRAAIEHHIEGVIAKFRGASATCFVRSAKEWQSVLDRNPFAREASQDPGRMTVLVLKETPPAMAWGALQRAISGREVVAGAGDHGYVVYPDGQGRSKLTLDRIERALGVVGTIRNWNTVSKVAELLSE
jgi:uncharacterized protein (DUF1697 family)